MNNQALAAYAKKVPFVVKAGIEGLADDNRLGMAVALMEKGRMTFSEMEAEFGLNPDTLSRYLTALQRGDLVRNYYEKVDGGQFSYYETTGLPEALLDAFFVATRKTDEGEERPTRPCGIDAAGRGGPDSKAV